VTLELARAAFARGAFEETLALAARALETSPDEARLLRINAALQLERWQIATDDLQWLIDRRGPNPKLAQTLSECWVRIGNANKGAQPETALVAYRNALAAEPSNSSARFNMALVLAANGRARDAIDTLTAALETDPMDAAAALLLAEQLIAVGDNEAAITTLQPIAESGNDEQRRRTAMLLVEAGAAPHATTIAERIESASTDWTLAFAAKLRAFAEIELAEHWLGAAERSRSDASDALRIALPRTLGLPSAHATAQAISATRIRFASGLRALIERYPPRRIAYEKIGADALLWDNFYLAYHGENDVALQREFGAWWSAALNAAAPQDAPQPRRSRRIAFVSSLFHQCTVGSYFAAWIEHIAACGWDVVLVNVGDRRDELTDRLSRICSGELTLNGSVRDNARAVRDVGADIIVYPELGLDYRTAALAAFRLAPVQVCGWGHPVTSGLPTIDVFLSCESMEPASARDHYTERLRTLPGLGTRYLSPPIPPALSRDDLGLPKSGTLYLVPHSLFKLHPDNDAVYAGVLAKDPRATLVFFEGVDSGARRIVRERLARYFAERGLDFAARTRFLPMRSREAFLQVLLAGDVVLDSLRFSGGNVSLDALHCGIPVVTHPGEFMRGRQTMGMLHQIRGGELICDSIASMIETAVDVANDTSRRKTLGAALQANLPALTQSDAPLRALDDTLNGLLESH
jgi:CRISPR-associated protein Csy1